MTDPHHIEAGTGGPYDVFTTALARWSDGPYSTPLYDIEKLYRAAKCRSFVFSRQTLALFLASDQVTAQGNIQRVLNGENSPELGLHTFYGRLHLHACEPIDLFVKWESHGKPWVEPD